MTRRTAVIGALVLICGIGLAGGGATTLTASAPPADDSTLDEIRAEIPDGFPGKYDLTEADARFQELVRLYGQTTDVADFGDGSQLSGPCGGFAYSYDENGDLLDAAMDTGGEGPPVDLLDGGQAFTSDNPFKVDTRGVVTYYGFSPESGEGPREHRWTIKTSGISLDSGGDPNEDLKNRNVGLVDLAEDLPVKFSAKVKVEGEMTSATLPTCIGKGHVDFIGNGLGDPVGIAALALLGGGLFGLLFNARPAYTYKGSS